MAISLLCGTPGAGKSYSAVQLCVMPALDLGRPIVTNLPLHDEAIAERWPLANIRKVQGTDWSAVWPEIPGGALVVVDESGAVFPAGIKSYQAGPERDWMAMHRHHVGPVGPETLSCEVVLIAQGSSDLARWLRTKVDRTYLVTKLDAIGASKRYRLEIYSGCQDTDKPLKRALISSHFGEYKPEVYGLYQSHTVGGGVGVSVRELRADKRTVWQSGTLRAAMFAPLVVAGALWWGWSMLPDAAEPKEVPGPVQKAAPAPVSVAGPVSVKVRAVEAGRGAARDLGTEAVMGGRATDDEWRLAAVLEGRGRWDVIVVRDGAKRTIQGAICERRESVTCLVDGQWVWEWGGKGAVREGLPASGPSPQLAKAKEPGAESSRETDSEIRLRAWQAGVSVPSLPPTITSGIGDLEALHAAVSR